MEDEALHRIQETVIGAVACSSGLSDSRAGTLIARRYKVERVLGKGSGGMVLLCSDMSAEGALVAVKLLTSYKNDPLAFERFHRESKVAREVRSPFLVRSFETFFDDGLFGFTMEYVPGMDLGALLSRITRAPVGFVCRMMLHISLGLEALHLNKLVHRDLKPANIIVTPELEGRLSDFGITKPNENVGTTSKTSVKFLDLSATRNSNLSTKITQHDELLGTVDYFSPEYILSGQVDARSDIYSLGIVMFEMFTGNVPYPVGQDLKAVWRRVRNPAPDLAVMFPCLPQELLRLIMRCLDRDPLKRPQEVAELIEVLQPLQPPR